MERVRTKRKRTLFFLFLLIIFIPSLAAADQNRDVAKGKNILVVASYHQGYRWCAEIIESLEKELSGARLTVFFMDTKRNLDQAEEKAEEAYRLYTELKPDAVITIDDNAVKYFVLPYLKGKVTTPVFFCGVNDDAGKYGLPAANVTGVLEKKHYSESISFAQVISPRVRAVAVLYKPSPSNEINVAQIKKEHGSYHADIIAYAPVRSIAELDQALAEHSVNVDALLLLNMTGIADSQGEKIEGHEAIAHVVRNTSLITIGASDWEVEAGALCGVIKTGEEQAALVASQLYTYWSGSQISELPLKQNVNGQRFLNMKTLKRLGLQLRPEMIIGSQILSGD